MAKSKAVHEIKITRNDGWKKLSGDLPVRMTNDYLFRSLMQLDNETLRALVTALLGLDQEEIRSAVVENPFMPGEVLSEKEYVLDVKVLLNEDIQLDIEMQVIHKLDWGERSLGYLCRLYDHLNRGKGYESIKTAIQIGLLDFTLFEDEPEFYSTYLLRNAKSGTVYTDKFRLCAVDLTRIDLATEEDKRRHLDEWAMLFKSKTWEEVQDVAEKNKDIENTVSMVYPMMMDEILQEQMIRREEYLLDQQYQERLIQNQQEQLADKDEQIADQQDQLADKDERIEKLMKFISDKGLDPGELEEY